MRLSDLHIIALIPARGGSKGIPGKNLMDFCGKPLLAWSVEQARASSAVRAVYVSSDDSGILAAGEAVGARGIRRPEALATDTIGVEEALIHALDGIEQEEQAPVDLVVFLQPTSPLRTRDDVDRALEIFVKEGADSLFSAARWDDVCLWREDSEGLGSITYDYRNRGRRQDRDPLWLENGSIYVFRPSILRQQRNRLGGKMVIYPMPAWKSFEIDSPQDVALCRLIMEQNILAGRQG